MPRPTLLYLALLPLLPIVVYLALPEPLRESYAYWSSDDLNAASEATFRSGSGGRAEGRVKTWRNMGYWKVCIRLTGPLGEENLQLRGNIRHDAFVFVVFHLRPG